MNAPGSVNNRGYWQWIPIAPYIPPSQTIAEDQKGKFYHSSWARYLLSRQGTEWVNYYLSNYVSNMDYALDNRWGEEADERMFLSDGATQTTRIPFKFPIISPMLTRMVGAVDNISINAKAEPATQWFAQTRKERALQEAMLMSEAAAAGPMMAAAYEGVGVSPDPDKTERIFDMNYTDHIARGANSIMSMLRERSRLDDTKRVVAGYMALSGLGAFHNFVNGQNIETEVCEPREVGWDTSAIKPDMSDGQFMYVCPLMSVSAIAERWNPSADVVEMLDRWARFLPGGYNFRSGWPQSRPRVFTVYWKDMKHVDRGFVMQDGEVVYTTINELDPDTGKPRYTDSDLVDPPENRFTLAWTPSEKRNKKQRRAIEVIRYCSMIPWEYLPGGYTKGRPYDPNKNRPPEPPNKSVPYVDVTGDIVFDYGEYPLQEADPDNVYSVKFPIKMSAWRYLGGHVVAPLTAAIDPQRWMNQITSDVAWRMRKAGGKSVAIAHEALTNMDESEFRQNLKEGDPVIIRAAAMGGIQNATAAIDTSPGPSFYNMVGLLPTMKGVAESAVGVYESNFGAPQGQDQLVGTLQLQLQQAGVMQQPFYAAIADLYRQQNQFYAQAGKQFYSRMPWLLSQMTGAEDMEALIQSKDMQLEQFRVKIELVPDGAQQRLIADQQIIPQLMQFGMLDPVTASQLMGRATPDDVYAAARKFTKMSQEAAAQQAEQAAAAQQQQAVAMEEAAIRDEDAAIAEQQTKADLEMAKLEQKSMQPFNQAASEWDKPDAALGGITGLMP